MFFDTLYVRWLGNTLFVGVLVVFVTLLLAVPAGYALARLTGKWGEHLGIGIFLTYLVPSTLLFIPMSRLIGDLGLQDSLWSLVLVYPSFTIPFCTWLLMGFFKAIPRDLEEAAMLDGYSRFGAFVKVVIPISLAGIRNPRRLVPCEECPGGAFVGASQDLARVSPSGAPPEPARA